LPIHLSVSGSIEANEQVEIRSEVSGIVEGIYFKEGNMVSKGQVLFKVNDTELQAQLGQAIAKQELAVETERRNKILLDKDVISREEYDIIQANLKTTQAQTQLIRAQIAKTSYKAPFSGKNRIALYFTRNLFDSKCFDCQFGQCKSCKNHFFYS
jgi:membrane fusion protein (multidrug efflux system)